MALAAALASVFVQPASAADWDSVAGWDVYEVDATRCVVGRVFAQAGATFGIIMATGGDVRVFATQAGWNARGGQKVDAAVGLDDQMLVSGASVGIEQGSNRGFVAAADDAFLQRFASARQLNLRAVPGAADTKLPLAGAAQGLAQGRRCLAGLRDGARPASVVPNAVAPATSFAPAAITASAGRVARPPVPRGSKSLWIRADDYPDAALRAAEGGLVTVKLAINATGTVSGCDVTRSSGSTALDETTCRLIQRRARYAPATDAAGKAVAGADEHTVRWAVPQ